MIWLLKALRLLIILAAHHLGRRERREGHTVVGHGGDKRIALLEDDVLGRGEDFGHRWVGQVVWRAQCHRLLRSTILPRLSLVVALLVEGLLVAEKGVGREVTHSARAMALVFRALSSPLIF